MPPFVQPYTLLLLSAVALSAAMAVTSFKMRPTPGTRAFTILMTIVALWALASSCEVVVPDLQAKAFCYLLKYLFIVTAPIAWLFFGLCYSDKLRHWSGTSYAALLVIPAITLVMVATNPLHQLMFTSLTWYSNQGARFIFRQFGPWFWIHTAYCYTLLLIGFFHLVRSLIDSGAAYRRQLISILVGGITPWVCNVLFIFFRKPLPYLDLTPFAFSISGLAFLWGIMRYRLLDIVPIARDIVIQELKEGIIVVDEAQRIVDLNPMAAQLLGGSGDAVIGHPMERVANWWTALQGTPPATLFKMERGGQTRLIHAMQSPICKKGTPIGSVIVLRDTTDRKAVEEALKRSEDRFTSLSENAPMLIFALDQAGVVTFANPAWSTILGYATHDVIGQPFTRFLEENAPAGLEEVLRRLINGHQPYAEIRLQFVHRDGQKRMFSTTAAVNADTEGNAGGVVGLARDITEEQKLQEQLFMAQKMEAIGTLAGGIAHDFNNLLMGIQANISLLRLEAETSDTFAEKLQRIEEQIQSGAGLTRQLLGYARKGKYRATTLDLHDVVVDTSNVVRRTNKTILVQLQLCAEPMMVEADRGQIESVLLNLFVNAMDAMPDGGTLTLSSKFIDIQHKVDRWPDLRPDRYIELQVADTGIGMDDRTRERIFEPFFTTKEIGRGTGLGLASAYGVVHNHGGSIRADSTPGQGSVFTLVLPVSRNSGVRMPPNLHGEVCLPSQKVTLLVVDDEQTILEFSAEMIKSLGFTAITAASGQDAIRIYQERHATIDLVLLDMVMPVMDGWSVYQEFKRINPRVKVIVASGHVTSSRINRILADGRHGRLQKPYSMDALARMIVKIIGSPTPQMPAQEPPFRLHIA